MRCPAFGRAGPATPAAPGTPAWARCRACGTWVQDPLPTEEELAGLYQSGYYRAWGADAEALERRAAGKRQTFARWLAGLPVRPPGRITHGTLAKARFPAGWFAVVTMCDVLEHLPAPDQALGRIRDLLAPEGVLLISTPNTRSLSGRLLGRFWPQCKAEHPILFSPVGLGRVLERQGFRVVARTIAWKLLSVAFLAEYFRQFPVPGLTAVLWALGSLLPDSLTRTPLPLAGGEMLIVARKA